MIESTRGIVLNYIKYKETSIIVRVFTQKYGLKSLIVNGIRSKKAKKSIGNFQPCTILDLQLYYLENKDLLRLNDAKIVIATPEISQNIKKSAIAIFITEILGKTLYHEHHENQELYQFLENYILQLDTRATQYEDFHVKFLIDYSSYLGFALTHPTMITTMELSEKENRYIDQLIHHSIEDLPYSGTGDIRLQCLKALIAYYMEHLDGLSEIKSLKVLHQIFH